MSRSAAFASISEERWKEYLAEKGVTLIGGSLDEAPRAYKNIETVVGLQGDQVDLVGQEKLSRTTTTIRRLRR